MRSRFSMWTAAGALAVTATLGTLSFGQSRTPIYLTGLINDYTPATINGQVAGPWEVHGEWSLLSWDGQHARFSAALTMEHSDQGVALAGSGDYDTPAGRHAHTHHIVLHGNLVAVNGGFQITGNATVTGNGSNPSDFAPVSPMTIMITGGTVVPLSNITITFGDPADNHFGKNPLHGVVLRDR